MLVVCIQHRTRRLSRKKIERVKIRMSEMHERWVRLANEDGADSRFWAIR
jgi:hypothetical protein